MIQSDLKAKLFIKFTTALQSASINQLVNQSAYGMLRTRFSALKELSLQSLRENVL